MIKNSHSNLNKKPTFFYNQLMLLNFSYKDDSRIAKFPWFFRPLLIIIREIISLCIRAKGLFIFPYREGAMATHHSVAFSEKEKFKEAYRKAVVSFGTMPRGGVGFRLHQAIWAASSCMKQDGNFVELGVGTGMTMSAVLNHLGDNWTKSGKKIFLIDTYSSIVTSPQTGEQNSEESNIAYAKSMDATRQNFREFSNVELIKGKAPSILKNIEINAISFMHIDLNAAEPEVESLKFLWKLLTPGAIILLDDYAYTSRKEQQVKMDALGVELGFEVLTLATGQGIIKKQ